MPFISLLIISLFTSTICYTGNIVAIAFDKSKYYSVFASTDEASINKEISNLQTIPNSSAFEGALIMKKADVTGNPKNKLSLFKEGKNKLENAIVKSPTNAEYRFLRLMIQENAPSFLGYNNNLEEDKKYIVSNYSSFDTVVKQAIQNYSKESKLLSPNLF